MSKFSEFQQIIDIIKLKTFFQLTFHNIKYFKNKYLTVQKQCIYKKVNRPRTAKVSLHLVYKIQSVTNVIT